ncbi:unnamed protein product [Protopolystoma xenopodis]|uniref:Uncharacterized protein n=1 Tax=Protopolystoma xenopodis TaxID=117903 RepID=A0A3S4ZXM9_9PLAT|nr:unnamed protein product [Protopolystoma xenopodis]
MYLRLSTQVNFYSTQPTLRVDRPLVRVAASGRAFRVSVVTRTRRWICWRLLWVSVTICTALSTPQKTLGFRQEINCYTCLAQNSDGGETRDQMESAFLDAEHFHSAQFRVEVVVHSGGYLLDARRNETRRESCSSSAMQQNPYQPVTEDVHPFRWAF